MGTTLVFSSTPLQTSSPATSRCSAMVARLSSRLA
jgi:hypothetical protein